MGFPGASRWLGLVPVLREGPPSPRRSHASEPGPTNGLRAPQKFPGGSLAPLSRVWLFQQLPRLQPGWRLARPFRASRLQSLPVVSHKVTTPARVWGADLSWGGQAPQPQAARRPVGAGLEGRRGRGALSTRPGCAAPEQGVPGGSDPLPCSPPLAVSLHSRPRGAGDGKQVRAAGENSNPASPWRQPRHRVWVL